jgi:glucokinase
MFDLLERSAYEQRFLHGRSVRALLSRMPVWVTEHGRKGVLGAAKWYLGRGAPLANDGGFALAGEAIR